MALIFKPTSRFAARAARPFAQALARSLAGVKGVSNRILGGFILRAVSDGKDVAVHVLEPPAVLALAVNASTTNYGTMASSDEMYDAKASYPLGAGDLCTPAATPPMLTGTDPLVAYRKGVVGLATISGETFKGGTFDAEYDGQAHREYQSFLTPSALLSLAIKYRAPKNANPFRQPLIALSRCSIGVGRGKGIDVQDAAQPLANFGYLEIDPVALGWFSDNTQAVGATEWGASAGALCVNPGVPKLIKYSVAYNEGIGKLVGTIDWTLDAPWSSLGINHSRGPWSAQAGITGGSQALAWVVHTTEDISGSYLDVYTLYRVAADGSFATVELDRDTAGEDGHSVYYPYIGAALTAEAAPALRLVAVVHILDSVNSGLSIAHQTSLQLIDLSGGKVIVDLPGLYPVGDLLGLYQEFALRYRSYRPRTPVCQYAPGYAAVLVSPLYEATDVTTVMALVQELRLVVVDVLTGAVVATSAVLTTYGMRDGLCLSTVEQGIVKDGVIATPARLLLSHTAVAGGSYRPFYAPLNPTDVFMIGDLSAQPIKIATLPHPADAHYAGTVLAPAQIGIKTNIQGILP